MTNSGRLISEADARWLSGRLCLLGEQGEEILAELLQAGYGLPVAASRLALEELAGTDARRYALRTYWREYAKERLAGLVGPMDILRGNLPKISAYRSEFLDKLRADAADGKLHSEGPINSPQIEPTIKQFVEMMPENPISEAAGRSTARAREQAAAGLGLVEDGRLAQLDPAARYKLLSERYLASLTAAGFTLDSHRKTGLVFRKITSDGRWAFLFVDDSMDGVRYGHLSTRFAITLPRKAVLPAALPLSAVATLPPEDIVPGFRAASGFARDSYPQFCFAADANAFLAKTVYARVDALLTDQRSPAPTSTDKQ